MPEYYDLYIVNNDPETIKSMVCLAVAYSLKYKITSDAAIALQEITSIPPRLLFLNYEMVELSARTFITKMSERYLFKFSTVYLLSKSTLDQNTLMQYRTLGFTEIFDSTIDEKTFSFILETNGLIGEKKSA